MFTAKIEEISMLRRTQIIFPLFCFLLVLSCSDDNNPTDPNVSDGSTELSLKEITIPEGLINKQNPYAQIAVGYMQLANSFKSFSGFFSPLLNIQSKSPMMKENTVGVWEM
jgi:hypothetical protein